MYYIKHRQRQTGRLKEIDPYALTMKDMFSFTTKPDDVLSFETEEAANQFLQDIRQKIRNNPSTTHRMIQFSTKLYTIKL